MPLTLFDYATLFFFRSVRCHLLMFRHFISSMPLLSIFDCRHAMMPRHADARYDALMILFH